jgi:hypothetical protein
MYKYVTTVTTKNWGINSNHGARVWLWGGGKLVVTVVTYLRVM